MEYKTKVSLILAMLILTSEVAHAGVGLILVAVAGCGIATFTAYNYAAQLFRSLWKLKETTGKVFSKSLMLGYWIFEHTRMICELGQWSLSFIEILNTKGSSVILAEWFSKNPPPIGEESYEFLKFFKFVYSTELFTACQSVPLGNFQCGEKGCFRAQGVFNVFCKKLDFKPN